MKGHLFFVCPTDNLELVINRAFKEDNYYFTSLGNSLEFCQQEVEEINALIETKGIREVTFTLSTNNTIFKNAVENDHVQFNRLKKFYGEISILKQQSMRIWKPDHIQVPIVAHYLNHLIQEIKPILSDWLSDQVKVNAKIYNPTQNSFNDTAPYLTRHVGWTLN